jgi:TRAP-type C4-dicarboxylate transport system permease small subunit
MVDKLAHGYHRVLLLLACLSMVAAFVCVSLGIVSRLMRWDVPGLDAYAGYAIASALFLALPATLLRGEHIRVTLVIDRLSGRWRGALEWWCLLAGLALAVYIAWYTVQLAWISYTTHDVSPAADATPLWMPQIAMVLGCTGLAVALAQAVWHRWQGRDLIHAGAADARTE